MSGSACRWPGWFSAARSGLRNKPFSPHQAHRTPSIVVKMRSLILAIATALTAVTASAQVEVVHPGPILDPSRAVQHVHTVASFHQPLPEQYNWPANDAAVTTGEKQLSQLKR